MILVYDSPQNMEQTIDSWIYEINEYAMEAARLVLVRTKIDINPM